jgi:stage V sporulation protein G
MEITDVRVFPVHEQKLRAFVSVVLDRCFMVNDIKVIRGRDGFFISMPSRRKKNGSFKDIAHPLNNDTRRWLEDRILSEYESAIGPTTAGRTEADDESSTVEAQPIAESPPVDGRAESLAAEKATEESRAKTLEEVEKHHLSDSFWTPS